MTTTQKTAAVWTPWAKILCESCHGPDGPRGPFDWTRIRAEVQADLNNPCEVKCDDCGCSCFLPEGQENLAAEQRLCADLKERGWSAVLGQTGGMCSAVTVDTPDSATVSSVYFTVSEDRFAVDAAALSEGTVFIAGRYDLEGDCLDEDGPWTEVCGVEGAHHFLVKLNTSDLPEGSEMKRWKITLIADAYESDSPRSWDFSEVLGDKVRSVEVEEIPQQRAAQIVPCPCGYWVDEDMEEDPSAATPMAIYNPAGGGLDCVECGRPLMLREEKEDRTN